MNSLYFEFFNQHFIQKWEISEYLKNSANKILFCFTLIFILNEQVEFREELQPDVLHKDLHPKDQHRPLHNKHEPKDVHHRNPPDVQTSSRDFHKHRDYSLQPKNAPSRDVQLKNTQNRDAHYRDMQMKNNTQDFSRHYRDHVPYRDFKVNDVPILGIDDAAAGSGDSTPVIQVREAAKNIFLIARRLRGGD